MPNDTPKTKNTRSNSSTNITLSDIKDLIETSKRQIISTLKSDLERVQKQCEALLVKISGLEDECGDLREKNSQLESRVTGLETKNSIISRSFSEMVDECNERSRRQLNLIITGVRESDGTIDERKRNDQQICMSLFRQIGLCESKIHDVQRIGKIGGDRPRLIRLSCETYKEKLEILRKAKTLSRSPDFKAVFVNPDRTLMEREEMRVLRTELRRRRENGEEVIIYRNQVVPRGSITNFRV